MPEEVKEISWAIKIYICKICKRLPDKDETDNKIVWNDNDKDGYAFYQDLGTKKREKVLKHYRRIYGEQTTIDKTAQVTDAICPHCQYGHTQANQFDQLIEVLKEIATSLDIIGRKR